MFHVYLDCLLLTQYQSFSLTLFSLSPILSFFRSLTYSYRVPVYGYAMARSFSLPLSQVVVVAVCPSVLTMER